LAGGHHRSETLQREREFDLKLAERFIVLSKPGDGSSSEADCELGIVPLSVRNKKAFLPILDEISQHREK